VVATISCKVFGKWGRISVDVSARVLHRNSRWEQKMDHEFIVNNKTEMFFGASCLKRLVYLV